MRTDLHFGVAVGIDCYPEIGNLTKARNDAKAFADWMRSTGVDGERLELIMLPDDAKLPNQRRGAEPRADQIWEAVRDKSAMARAAVAKRPQDWFDTRLYFFFSGHGIAPTARDAAGLAADAGPEDFGNSASVKAMVEYFLESGDFAEIVAVADCCRQSPAKGGVSPGRPPWTPRSASRPEDVRVAELFATRYRTLAREPSGALGGANGRNLDDERGYFTHAILEGLAGDPEAIANGDVTTHSLNKFARQRVIDRTHGKQKPPTDVGDDIVLLSGVAPKVGAGTRDRTVRIAFPAGFRGRATLIDGTLRELATRDVGGDDWSLPLPPGLYRVETAGAAFANDGQLRVPEGEGEFRVAL